MAAVALAAEPPATSHDERAATEALEDDGIKRMRQNGLLDLEEFLEQRCSDFLEKFHQQTL